MRCVSLDSAAMPARVDRDDQVQVMLGGECLLEMPQPMLAAGLCSLRMKKKQSCVSFKRFQCFRISSHCSAESGDAGAFGSTGTIAVAAMHTAGSSLTPTTSGSPSIPVPWWRTPVVPLVFLCDTVLVIDCVSFCF